jgi:hypothetical protein
VLFLAVFLNTFFVEGKIGAILSKLPSNHTISATATASGWKFCKKRHSGNETIFL